MINFYNGKMEGLVTSGTKIQMTYICRDERPIIANIINDGVTHLVVGPTIYFLCLSLSKLQTPFILPNGEDLNPFVVVEIRSYGNI